MEYLSNLLPKDLVNIIDDYAKDRNKYDKVMEELNDRVGLLMIKYPAFYWTSFLLLCMFRDERRKKVMKEIVCIHLKHRQELAETRKRRSQKIKRRKNAGQNFLRNYNKQCHRKLNHYLNLQ